MSLEFLYDEVFPIAMIQSKKELTSDLTNLNKYLKTTKNDFSKYKKEEIWVAYERCGYDPSGITKYIEKGGNIEIIPFHITEEVWNQITPCRQVTFRTMISSPNNFFYRNKPPGKQALKGPWTQEEKEQFYDRLQLFKHFKKTNSQWGFFSVPLARYGYSCAAFSKEFNVREFAGRKQPEYPDMTPEEFDDYLEKQAVDYIFQCMKSVQYLTIESLSPVNVGEHQNEKTDNKKQMKKSASTPQPHPNQYTAKKNPKNDDFLKTLDTTDLNIEKNESMPTSLSFGSSSDKKKQKKNKTQKEGSVNTKMIHPPPPVDEYNLTLGAIDEVTKKPMKKPAINRDGYVLDKSTWYSIIDGEIECPYDVVPLSKNEIIMLDNDNFHLFKPYIRNVIF